MKKTLRKILTRVCAAVLLCGMVFTTAYNYELKVEADEIDDLEQQIKDNEAQIKDLEDKISSIDADIANSEVKQSYYFDLLIASQEQIDLLNNKLYAKEQEIADKEQEIADIEVSIADTEKQIEDKKLEIEALDKQNKDNIYRFGQIIRAMYITDSDDYLAVIAGASDFYDIFVRSEILKSASDQNVKFMHDLLDDIHRLEDESVQLQKDVAKLDYDKANLITQRDVLEDERVALDEERNYVSLLSASYNDSYNEIVGNIANFEALQDKYAQQIQVSEQEIKDYEAKIDEYIRQQQENASNNVEYDQGEWRWPLEYRFHYITTYFGYDPWRGGNHGAIDVGDGGINGSNIYASKGGEVIVAKTTYIPGYDYGKYIVIDHGNGYQTLYAHCSEIFVTVGQRVSKGDVIALVGSTGWSTGPHLHFEVRKDGVRVNPLDYVNVPG